MWLAIKEFTEGFWIEHPDIIIGPRPDPLNVPFVKQERRASMPTCFVLCRFIEVSICIRQVIVITDPIELVIVKRLATVP